MNDNRCTCTNVSYYIICHCSTVDSFSPLLFIVSLIPLTVQLNLNLRFTRVWHESFWTTFSCHLWVSHKQIIKIYIYTRVTLESLSKLTGSLASSTQVLNKFVGLLVSSTQALNEFVVLLVSCMWTHDLMNLWSAPHVRNILHYL